jgi:hypothetical protein
LTADAVRTTSVLARDNATADGLILAGVDSPLKLDLVAVLEQAPGNFVSVETLATRCGTSQRDAALALDALARRGLVECRRFYNLTEYAAARTPHAAEALHALEHLDATDLRRLRRAVLIRTHLGAGSKVPAAVGA